MRRYKRKNYEKRNQVIMALFLGLLMVVSIFGVVTGGSVSQQQNSVAYGDYVFDYVIENGQVLGFSATLNGAERQFYQDPQSVLYLTIPAEAERFFSTALVQMSFNPNRNEDLVFLDIARTDITDALQEQGVFVSSGVTQKAIHPAYQAFPLVTCSDGTSEQPVILFAANNVTRMVVEGDCLRIEGSNQEFLFWRDRILYHLYGVI